MRASRRSHRCAIVAALLSLFLPEIACRAEERVPLEPFGVGSHWNEAEYFHLAKAAGVQWLRMDISWYHVQPEGPGEWRWEPIDRALDEADRLGLKVLAILSYSTRWSTSGDPADRNPHRFAQREEFDGAYQVYLRAVVERYHGRVDAWEIMNEPDHYGFLKIGPGSWAARRFPGADNDEQRRRQYLHHLDLAAEAIGPFRDRMTLTTSGYATGGNYDTGFIDWLTSQPGFFAKHDVLNAHRYGYPNHSGMLSVIAQLRTIREAQGLSIPIWITEHGITEHTAEEAPADAGAFLIKSYALALSHGADKLFWYRHAPGGNHVTLLLSNREPSVVHAAYRVLTRHWREPIAIGKIGEIAPGSPGLTGAFADRLDGHRVAILWATAGADPAPTVGSLRGTVTSAFDVGGEPVSVDESTQVTSDPLFVYLSP